jgi:hypothetical protein
MSDEATEPTGLEHKSWAAVLLRLDHEGDPDNAWQLEAVLAEFDALLADGDVTEYLWTLRNAQLAQGYEAALAGLGDLDEMENTQVADAIAQERATASSQAKDRMHDAAAPKGPALTANVARLHILTGMAKGLGWDGSS